MVSESNIYYYRDRVAQLEAELEGMKREKTMIKHDRYCKLANYCKMSDEHSLVNGGRNCQICGPCECNLIRTIRADQILQCIKTVSGAYVTDSHGALEESSWNTAISVALEYLREEYA